jgi:hypothetical protein
MEILSLISTTVINDLVNELFWTSTLMIIICNEKMLEIGYYFRLFSSISTEKNHKKLLTQSK